MHYVAAIKTVRILIEAKIQLVKNQVKSKPETQRLTKMLFAVALQNCIADPVALDWTELNWTGLDQAVGDESVVPAVPAGNRK